MTMMATAARHIRQSTFIRERKRVSDLDTSYDIYPPFSPDLNSVHNLVKMSCLRCRKVGNEKLFSMNGCRNICFLCSRCHDDRKLTDENLLASIAGACGICLPHLARALAKRSCVHCRKFGQSGVSCNCIGGHYVCQDCMKNANGAALKSLEAKHVRKEDAKTELPTREATTIRPAAGMTRPLPPVPRAKNAGAGEPTDSVSILPRFRNACPAISKT